MPHALNQSLKVAICKDADAAVRQGFLYRAPEYTGLKIEQVVVVREGTVEGNSSVDLVLVDEAGKKFVTMVTGRLLKSIPT